MQLQQSLAHFPGVDITGSVTAAASFRQPWRYDRSLSHSTGAQLAEVLHSSTN